MSGRLTSIVCYHICDPKRLRQVYQPMRGFGDHLQLSVFRCDLSPAEKVRMMASLEDLVHHGEDQVLIVPLGPPSGRNPSSMETVGLPLAHPERHTVVV